VYVFPKLKIEFAYFLSKYLLKFKSQTWQTFEKEPSFICVEYVPRFVSLNQSRQHVFNPVSTAALSPQIVLWLIPFRELNFVNHPLLASNCSIPSFAANNLAFCWMIGPERSTFSALASWTNIETALSSYGYLQRRGLFFFRNEGGSCAFLLRSFFLANMVYIVLCFTPYSLHTSVWVLPSSICFIKTSFFAVVNALFQVNELVSLKLN
jgi:hypothetical protein